MFRRKNKQEKALKEVNNLKVQTRRKEKIKKEKVDKKWIRQIIITTFILSFILSFISETTIPSLSLIFGILLTLIFVLLGILFDILGVAVTSADIKVFHSMSARKVPGARLAVKLKQNTEKVSNFCCDVVGDICGIISGAAAATISVAISTRLKTDPLTTSILIAAIVASLTIGGKALGKSFAINKSNIILYEVSKVISYIKK